MVSPGLNLHTGMREDGAELRLAMRVSLVAQTVKNLSAMQVAQVRSLAQEDPLEEGMATRSSILAWRIPRTEEPGGLPSKGSQRTRHN